MAWLSREIWCEMRVTRHAVTQYNAMFTRLCRWLTADSYCGRRGVEWWDCGIAGSPQIDKFFRREPRISRSSKCTKADCWTTSRSDGGPQTNLQPISGACDGDVRVAALLSARLEKDLLHVCERTIHANSRQDALLVENRRRSYRTGGIGLR